MGSNFGFDCFSPFASLPIVTPAPKARRDLVLPPPTQLELSAKGVVPPPEAAKEIITKGVPAGGAAGGIGFWDWIAAHPWETAGLALVGAGAVGGAVYALIISGVDVSSIATQVPSWAWPIVLIFITALFQFFRNLADSRHKEELAEVTASTREN